MKSFDKVGLIKEGWEVVKKNVKFVAVIVAAYVIYNIAQGLIQDIVKDSVLAAFVAIAFGLLTIFLEIGLLKIGFKLVDGKEAKFEDFWAYPQYFLRFLGASIITGLAVTVGFILLVVPGIYIALRLMFTPFFVVDKNMGVFDALKASWDLSNGNVINLFLFMLLVIALNILGLIALFVGLFITVPVSFFAVLLLFRKLTK